MKGPATLGRIAVAIIVGFAAVVVGGAPARAGGPVRYENVGNPSWCMYADWLGPHLKRCSGNATGTLWWWHATPYPGQVRLTSQYTTTTCLTATESGLITTSYCSPDRADQYWHVWGHSGWVVYQKPGTSLCIKPVDTHIVKTEYLLRLDTCPAVNNVDNIFAWRYF